MFPFTNRFTGSTRRSDTMNSYRFTWQTCVAAGMVACLASACSSRSSTDQILTPARADFDALFAPQDTIRLDKSVLIGRTWMLDVNSRGELLVLDLQSEDVHLFSPEGELVRTMAVRDCNPEAAFNYGSQATFLGDSEVAVLSSKGLIIFDQNGACARATSNGDFAASSWGICAHEDTVFSMPRGVRDSTFIRAYDQDFTLLDQFPLPAPEFPIRAAVTLTYPGFAMACFDDGLWWVHSESFDASPLLRRPGLTRFKPDFFVDRTRDYPEFETVTQSNFQSITEMLNRAEAEATAVLGMFALDSRTRLVVYQHIDAGSGEFGTGAMIASHSGRFPGVSTLLPRFPSAARSGMLYMSSDPEDEPGGEATNPAILRYRFVPPTSG